MDKDEIQLILVILMIIFVAIELIYIFWRRRKKRVHMPLRRKEKGESLSERAHNLIITTESISSTLAGQGVDTIEADNLLKSARNSNTGGDYTTAIEKAEAAKLALLRAKREKATASEVEGPRDLPLTGDDTVEPLPEPAPGKDQAESVSLDKLPKNFMQAKFMISTIKDQLKQKGISDGDAYDLMEVAEGHFQNEEYSRALSTAIKAERLLDSETLGLIGEEEKEEEEEVTVEELVCPGCENTVSLEDAFCRKCGEKLDFRTTCPGCDAEIAPDDQFCRKCGERLD